MPRRVNLPAADDLFRPTEPPPATEPGLRERRVRAVPTAPDDDTRTRRPSGRVRHDEKITIYVTAEELLDLEHARLELRRDHGLAVDRGRLVREAVALVLADLDEHGHDSMLVQRLIED
ncbi:MAG: hypothetical protein J2P22_02540 [Nocardioides sp.]|nr:hypothetical protein [Nocardioides sp.]